jgi:hypothetical protein
MQTAPGIPEAVARTDNRYPVKVTIIVDTIPSQIKLLKESRTPSGDPPLSPEEILPSARMGMDYHAASGQFCV